MTVNQLDARGLARSSIRGRAATGRLHRVHHGVYALTPPRLLSRDGRFMAAVLACGPNAALSHASAALLLDLWPSSAVKIDVTIPKRSGRRRDGIRIHRSTTLRPRDVIAVENIPCTSVARTIFDLAEGQDRRGVERILDRATTLRVLNLRALQDQIDNNPNTRAGRILTQTLNDHRPGSTTTESPLEEEFLAFTRDLGLPDPEVQPWLDLGDGDSPIRADLLLRAQRVIIELDGFGTHGTRGSFESDRRRDQRASAAGYRTIRITRRQLRDERQRLARLLMHLTTGSATAWKPSRPNPSEAQKPVGRVSALTNSSSWSVRQHSNATQCRW